ncbi:Thiosulfate reductase cytochrome B subunit (membrane anchoring protein)-like protein [Rhizorhabdus wittichii RW1]|uniref:Thiosulfate reductase cytochrome B subunit (Membrane anchoring protein)-like protein n=1 Tax=Rhizorhabdus wittichii (strain DSM 6014 / CCUG 31198 / JCM 15750 / NBRC 105917 / EY 4224 / RW1) TaxID=392499 RepID=A0A9J9LG41_RHIWR|nr:Thiosulfate reductase cytochrome B subunit (membrane anchoring protein)-like protein [Rhizorhabdus wittichii RW1]
MTRENEAGLADPAIGRQPTVVVVRHSLVARLWHWTTAGTVVLLLWSGVMIFNVHPRLYWGDSGHKGEAAIMEVAARDLSRTPLEVIGRAGGYEVDLTGWLGSVLDLGSAGKFFVLIAPSADFQFGATRALHFLAAEVLIATWIFYAVYLMASRRLGRWVIYPKDMSPRIIFGQIKSYFTFWRKGRDAEMDYNPIQKMIYIALFFILIPVAILSGMTMSNAMTARFPLLLDMFGGRQSARTIHFIAAGSFALFVVVHIAALLMAGPVNHMRAIVTGRFRITQKKGVGR